MSQQQTAKALPFDELTRRSTEELVILRDAYQVAIERIDRQPDDSASHAKAKRYARDQYVTAVANIITILTERKGL